jgi:hypothetical protein
MPVYNDDTFLRNVTIESAGSGSHGCETSSWLSGNRLQDVGYARFVF